MQKQNQMPSSLIGIRRILMTTDTIGGVWTYALELCRALEKRGVEVILATMGRPLSRMQQQAVAALGNVAVRESDYRLEWMASPWEDVKAAGKWLLDIEKSVRPDLVHLNSYAHGALPWSAPVLVVGHSCVFSWFAAVKREKPPGRWRRYHREVARGLKGADQVTAPTRAMLECLKANYGEFRADAPIYNGRLAADFPPGAKEPFIFSAGRLWDEAKNAALIEQVAPVLSWPVLMAGDCRHPDGRNRKLGGIRHLGFLAPAEMADRLGKASIFALPARYEPFGLSALEAALAGCALVLGDIPSLREVWEDAAFFVSPETPEGLGTVLEKLIARSDLRRQYAAKARSRALAFAPERMADEYGRLYTTLVARKDEQSGELQAV